MSGPADFRLVIPGQPVPASRPRVTRNGTHIAPRYRTWKRDASVRCRRAWKRKPITMGVAVSIEVTLPRPQSRPAKGSIHRLYWHPTEDYPLPLRGDADNYAKAALDALTQGGVIRDDNLVVELTVTKWGGDTPGVDITVHIVEPEGADISGVAAK